MGNILSSILTGLHFSTGGVGTLISIATSAPQLIDDAKEIVGTASTFIPVAKTLYADLTEIASDAKAGKWNEEPANIERLTGHIQAAWAKANLDAPKIAAAAQRLVQPKAA